MADFGETLEEMDVEAFLNIRDWVESAIVGKGARITDAGIGAGRADLGFELEGMQFSLQIAPRASGNADTVDSGD